jgi:hypothetical protein
MRLSICYSGYLVGKIVKVLTIIIIMMTIDGCIIAIKKYFDVDCDEQIVRNHVNCRDNITINDSIIIGFNCHGISYVEYEQNDIRIYIDESSIDFTYKKYYKCDLLVMDENTIELCDNEVMPKEERNKGLGTVGITYVCDFIKKAGYTKIIGEIGGYDDIDQIIHFYEKNQFIVDGMNITRWL